MKYSINDTIAIFANLSFKIVQIHSDIPHSIMNFRINFFNYIIKSRLIGKFEHFGQFGIADSHYFA